jgi:hypothetical protein
VISRIDVEWGVPGKTGIKSQCTLGVGVRTPAADGATPLMYLRHWLGCSLEAALADAQLRFC